MKVLIFIDIVDMKDISDDFFLKIKKLLGNTDSTITLLTVLSPHYMLYQVTGFPSSAGITEGERRLQTETKLQHVAEQFHLPNRCVQSFVETGAPKERILHLASEIHADLIVVPSHTPLSGGLLRSSVGASILKQADTSVLIIPIKKRNY